MILRHSVFFLTALVFTTGTLAANSVNWANIPANGSSADSSMRWNNFDVNSVYDGNCGQTALAEASGSCELINNDGSTTARVERSIVGCFQSKRINDYALRMKPGNVSGALDLCTVNLSASSTTGSSAGGRREIKVNQKITWDTIVSSDIPYEINALTQTVDGLADTAIAITFTSLTPSLCVIDGNRVTNLATGTCRIKASAGGSNSLVAPEDVINEWAVLEPRDTDADEIHDYLDNCPLVSNFNQENTDGDAEGNACDLDDDNDNFNDDLDNCPLIDNNDQLDTDADNAGNLCDDDDDNDGASDAFENYSGTNTLDPTSFPDSNQNGVADNLESDSDGDGVPNSEETGGDPYQDNDADGVPAYLDDDDLNDQVGDADGRVEQRFIARGDGLPDFLNPVDVTETQIVYVNHKATGSNDGSSWENAYTELSQAMQYARVAGDQIWVAQGVYMPSVSNPEAAFVLSPGVSVFGGFYGKSDTYPGESLLSESNYLFYETVLSGDMTKDDANTVKNVTQKAVDIKGENSDQILIINGQSHVPNKVYGISIVGGSCESCGGSALAIHEGRVIIENVTIKGNQVLSATSSAGAIKVSSSAATKAQVTFSNVTIKDNTSIGKGAALGVLSGSVVMVDQAVIHDNIASDAGAAILVSGTDSRIKLKNATLASNQSLTNKGSLAVADGALANLGFVTMATGISGDDSVYNDSNITITGANSRLTLANTLVLNSNSENNTIVLEQSAQVEDEGFNALGIAGISGVRNADSDAFTPIFNSGTSFINEVSAASDLINLTLGEDGGLTMTLPLKSNSPLIDAVPESHCLNISNTDQRGYARAYNGACDIGAFEYTDRDNFCWDDGALIRSADIVATNAYCLSTNGSDVQEVLDNLKIGSFYQGLCVFLLALAFYRSRKSQTYSSR